MKSIYLSIKNVPVNIQNSRQKLNWDSKKFLTKTFLLSSNMTFDDLIICVALQFIYQMSLGGKIAIGLSCAVASGIIVFVHKAQQDDRRRLREGVVRDQERQEKKRQNIEELKQQQELRALLERQEQEEAAVAEK